MSSDTHDSTQDSMNIEEMASLKHWGEPPSSMGPALYSNAIVDCGWGRLIFGQTFESSSELARQLRNEDPGRRDLALYSRDPQVVVSKAPQELFIDPSLTFRLNLHEASLERSSQAAFGFRQASTADDLQQVNRIYQARGMVSLRDDFEAHLQQHPEVGILLAFDNSDGHILGCVTGVDHFRAFEDPDNGSSLWALAVDPQCHHPGVGKALVIELARHFRSSGRLFMDLSVMHDNQFAIDLYNKLGFEQVPVYCLKTRNAINEQLYVGPKHDETLNIYAQIIVDEAYRRGIQVDIIDAANGFFRLSLGGRIFNCRESLTDLTTAVAMSRCDDKAVTRRFLQRADLRVPQQQIVETEAAAVAFLQQHGQLVIKPARGEQGHGVAVDLRDETAVRQAWQAASLLCDKVLAEEFVQGQDLRIIVINEEVVAAAVRKPARIVGDGEQTVQQLIEKQSRRRAAATQGESRIPMDSETLRCIHDQGLTMDTIPEYGRKIQVRKTANLHTGGTLHDVTDKLHPVLVNAAVRGARVLDMPLVGFDFLVPDPGAPDYVIIEANERPGLANHEPQPTAARLIDMLFPQTALGRLNEG